MQYLFSKSIHPSFTSSCLTHENPGTECHAEEREIMDNIYAFITNRLRGNDLAEAYAEPIATNTFISSVIFRNRLIYHEIHSLLLVNGLPMDYTEVKRQTPVVFRIMKALWTEEYDELTKILVKCKKGCKQQSNTPSNPPNPETKTDPQSPSNELRNNWLSQYVREQSSTSKKPPLAYKHITSHNSSFRSSHKIGNNLPKRPLSSSRYNQTEPHNPSYEGSHHGRNNTLYLND